MRRLQEYSVFTERVPSDRVLPRRHFRGKETPQTALGRPVKLTIQPSYATTVSRYSILVKRAIGQWPPCPTFFPPSSFFVEVSFCPACRRPERERSARTLGP